MKDKTLKTDQLVVIGQKTGPGPKNKDHIVTTVDLYNIRTGKIKPVYVVQGYRNVKHWNPVLSDPDNSFVITNCTDKDLNTIDADSDISILEHITAHEAQEIVDLTLQRMKQQPSQPVIVEPVKPKAKKGNMFNSLFDFTGE